MFSRKSKGGDASKRPKQGEKPYRDLYDWLMLFVGSLGVVGIVVTLWMTRSIAESSSRDMSNALGSMTTIAGTLEHQQVAIINQSEATENLASETDTVANATMNEAETSATNAKTARQQLVTANKQLSQNVTLFAAQHRPIMGLDLMGAHNKLDQEGNAILWDYNFKNVGQGPAYNVFYYEAISVNHGPFQELPRVGSRVDPPNSPHWSTAMYKLSPGEAVSEPSLRVRFVYSDILGRRYEDTSCIVYEGADVTRDCAEPQRRRRAKKNHG